jgi:hypothetical protein
MVTGYKPGSGPAATGTRWFVAVALVAVIGAFWAGAIPAPGLAPGKSIVQAAMQPSAGRGTAKRRHHDDD